MKTKKTFGSAKGKKNITKSGTLKKNSLLNANSKQFIEEIAIKEAL